MLFRQSLSNVSLIVIPACQESFFSAKKDVGQAGMTNCVAFGLTIDVLSKSLTYERQEILKQKRR